MTSLAEAAPRLAAEMVLDSHALSLDESLEVKVELSDVSSSACLYFPAIDPSEIALNRAFDLQPIVSRRSGYQDAELNWIDKGGLIEIRPSLYRIASAGNLNLKYRMQIAGWHKSNPKVRTLAQWHPQYIENCPSDNPTSLAAIPLQMAVKVTVPNDYKLLFPGEFNSDRAIEFVGRELNLVVHRESQVTEEQVGPYKVKYLSQKPLVKDAMGKVSEALKYFSSVAGQLPYSDLILVETENFEPLPVQGVIAINIPRQALLQYAQTELTNWSDWQLYSLIAKQWFGANCKASGANDYWLSLSLADVMTYTFLQSRSHHFELFKTSSFLGRPLAELNYRQMQDLIAASLEKSDAFSSLIDSKNQSYDVSLTNAKYSYIRATQALRSMRWQLGPSEFSDFLRSLILNCQESKLEPQMALKALDGEPKAQGLLQKYWQSNEWPDARIERTFVRDDKYYVEVSFENGFLMPADLWIEDSKGDKRLVYLKPDMALNELELTEDEYDTGRIFINPGRSFYDFDRFNNSTRWPSVKFSPVARGLSPTMLTQFFGIRSSANCQANPSP